MKKIGVEESLKNVQQALQDKGYEVVKLKQNSDAKGCAACVITGLDNNVMGMQTTSLDGPVIEASGLTADEICEELENKLS